MDPRAALVAAKFSGSSPWCSESVGSPTTSADSNRSGRLSSKPRCTKGLMASGLPKWRAVAVQYEHLSPRIITHVGMFMYDQWFIDEMPKGRHMDPNDVATFTVEYPLPETL